MKKPSAKVSAVSSKVPKIKPSAGVKAANSGKVTAPMKAPKVNGQKITRL